MNNESSAPASKGLTVLKLLWNRFIRQPWGYKLITVAFILLTFIWMLIFYTTFILWQVFSLLMTKPLLHIIEWYLLKTDDM